MPLAPQNPNNNTKNNDSHSNERKDGLQRERPFQLNRTPSLGFAIAYTFVCLFSGGGGGINFSLASTSLNDAGPNKYANIFMDI